MVSSLSPRSVSFFVTSPPMRRSRSRRGPSPPGSSSRVASSAARLPRAAGGPDVQGGDMAVANVLLVHRVDRRLPQGKRGLDQAPRHAVIAHR